MQCNVQFLVYSFWLHHINLLLQNLHDQTSESTKEHNSKKKEKNNKYLKLFNFYVLKW